MSGLTGPLTSEDSNLSAGYLAIVVKTRSGTKTFRSGAGIDNRATIISVFAFAAANLPDVSVEFGPGQHEIHNGVEINLPDGSKRLTVTGPGTILLSGTSEFSGTWSALRIRNTSLDATDESEFLEDISIIGLNAIDDAPWLHSGDSEETHGFNIGYCKRAAISGCTMQQIGDEAIEFDYCLGLIATNNHCFRCNFVEEGGGAAISVKNGCRDGIVGFNTIKDNLPDAWDATVTYAKDQRARGSDNKTYKSVADANLNNDPTSTSPASWTDLSTINSGDGVLTYGIDIKIISAYPVKRITIIGNTIENMEYSGIQFGATGEDIFDVAVIGNTIKNANYGIIKESTNSMERVTIADNLISDININGLKTESGSGTDKFFTIESNSFNNITGDFAVMAAASNYVFRGNNIQEVGGRGVDVATSTDMVIDANTWTNCGVSSKTFIQCSNAGQNIKFNGNTVVNCDSEEQFLRNVDIANGNDIDLVSPSYRSINSVSEACNNTMNGGIRRGIAGPLMACNNTLTGTFNLGATTRGLIGLDVSGVSNKGSIISNNTISNSDPTTVSQAIRIHNQNSESANVICTSNHCGLGTRKTISDLSTASVVANNIVT